MTSRVPWEGSPGTANHTSGLRLLQWNMQQSLLNFDLLYRFLTHNYFDILLIQEPPERVKEG